MLSVWNLERIGSVLMCFGPLAAMVTPLGRLARRGFPLISDTIKQHSCRRFFATAGADSGPERSRAFGEDIPGNDRRRASSPGVVTQSSLTRSYECELLHCQYSRCSSSPR